MLRSILVSLPIFGRHEGNLGNDVAPFRRYRHADESIAGAVLRVLSFHLTVSHREPKEQEKMGEEAATLVNFSRQTRKEGCKTTFGRRNCHHEKNLITRN